MAFDMATAKDFQDPSNADAARATPSADPGVMNQDNSSASAAAAPASTVSRENSGFDIKSAMPLDTDFTITHLADKDMNISHPAGMSDGEITDTVRDQVYAHDPVPTVPEEGKKPFMSALVDKLALGYGQGIANVAHILGVDKTKFMQDNVLFNQKEADFLNKGTETADPYKQFGYHFVQGVGGLLSTLPVDIATGGATKGFLLANVGARTAQILRFIPGFALGGALRGAAQGAEEGAPEGPAKAAELAAQKGTENLVWGTLYGHSGTGIMVFPKMMALGAANATYEAAKQNRLPDSKELYTGVAEGLAYAAVFAPLGYMSGKSERPVEAKAMDESLRMGQDAANGGDMEKVQQIYDDLLKNENIRPEIRDGMKQIYDQTRTENIGQVERIVKPSTPVEQEVAPASGAEAATKGGESIKPPETSLETPRLLSDTIAESKAPDLIKTELTRVNDGRDISPDEIGAQTHVLENYPEAKQAYIDRSMKEFGADNVVSSDIGKFAIPGMKASMSAAFHESGSALAKDREQELLNNPDTKDLPVAFMAGGSGAGKSNTLRGLGIDIQNSFALVHDTNLNNFESAKAKIDRALKAGHDVKILYVYRDPIKAYSEGVLPRVRTQDRIVPIKDHADTHLGVQPTLEKILKEYPSDKVSVEAVLNTGAKGEAKMADLADIPKISYTHSELSNLAFEHLQEALENGKITEAEYETALEGSPDLQSTLAERQDEPGQSSGMGAEEQPAEKHLSRLNSESGQIDLGSLPGAEKGAKAIQNALDFLKRSREFTPEAEKLFDALNQIKTQRKADEIRAVQLLKNLNISPKDYAAIYKYADNMEVFGDPKGATLTTEQEKVYNETLKPLQKATDDIFRKVRDLGFPLDKTGHLPREVEGKGGMLDRIRSGIKNYGQGSILNKTFGGFKKRVMNAITSESSGNRVVVSIKKGEVTAYQDGVATDLGKLNLKSYGDLRKEEMAPLEHQAKVLEKEQDTLTATKGRYLAAESRIEGIHLKLSEIYDNIAKINDKYSSKDLEQKVFVDNNGKLWKVGEATTDEIEANTNLTYHKNPVLNVMGAYLKLRQIERATDFLEQLKTSPDFKNIGVKFGAGSSIPENWRAVDMPQFRGYAFEPRVADTLDSFYKKMKSGDDPIVNTLSAMNGFLRSAIFFNPFIHIPNISVHWAVNRGIAKWFMPKEYITLAGTATRAIEAVFHQNADYLEMLDKGANLLYHDVAGDKVHDLMLKKMGEELETNGPLRDNLAKALGYVDPRNLIKAIYDFSGKATWSVNDIATMQAVYEEMNHGKTMEEAIGEVGKHIPNYRLPARILDSKLIGDIMSNPNLTMFGAYHYGALKSYGEMIKSLVDVKNDPKGAAASLDKLAMAGLIGFVIYPALDNVARALTGNQDASFRRAGATTVPYNTYQMLKGKMDFTTWLFSIATPAPLLKSGVELTLNRNLFTGKPVVQSRETMLHDLANYAKNQVSPVAQVEKIRSGQQSGKEAALGLIGIKSPHHVAHTDAEQKAMNIMRTQNFGGPEMTDAQRERYQLKQSLASGYAKTHDQTELNKYLDAGEITKREKKAIVKDAGMAPIVRMTKSMSVEEVQKVFDTANTDEKKSLIPVLQKKIENRIKLVPTQQKEMWRQLKASLTAQ